MLRCEGEQVFAGVARPEREESLAASGSAPAAAGARSPKLGSNTSVSISASSITYAWSSSEPSGCSALARQPVTMLAPSANSTSGRLGDEDRDRTALGQTLRGVGLRVATHLRRDLATGQHLIAEIHRGPIGMAVERRDQEVGQERSFVQIVGHVVCPTASVFSGSNVGFLASAPVQP